MELYKRVITCHGGQEIIVLSPLAVHSSITAGHDHKGFPLIWGNGSGYTFLAECFSIAAELMRNEVLYLPAQFKGSNEFLEIFDHWESRLSIVCTNYCETQLSPKDIEKVLQVKVYSEQIINRTPVIKTEYMDNWKTHRRITVKIKNRNMYISTNRDGYSTLGWGASDLAEYGDRHYEFHPHQHFDRDDNTSSSVGVTLYHWNDTGESLS